MPKVSVIIPNYNHAKYLQARIDSVLNQSFTDFEVILLDDCSPDNSREIIAIYEANPLIKKMVLNETNSGSSFAQWNKGLSLATGDYVWIAESDDIADKEFLSTLVPILNSNEKVALVYSQSYDIDESGQIKGTWQKLTDEFDNKRWKQDFISPGIEEIRKYFIYKNTIPNASAVLFRRSVVEEVGGPASSYKLNGDWHFWIKLLLNHQVAYVAQCLNFFRSHQANVRSKAALEGLNFYEYARIIDFAFAKLDLSPAEKQKVIEYFNRQFQPEAPATIQNIFKSYLKLARWDKSALKLLVWHLKHRYFSDSEKA
jgi:glycosyltransferase involved in cell wall biosynthesis